ncbi:MAG: EamA family transporter RarD [Spirochaetaceae bacterium]|nr:EamA family transporter RarD [Spirochaetaceae bacterium]
MTIKKSATILAMNNSSFGKGILFTILAYVMWGVIPLYWKLLIAIDPLHVLAFRIICSFLFVSLLLIIQKNFAWLLVFKERKKCGFLILASIAVTFNWGLFIWAVNTGHAIEASLGFYINPLVSIVFGLIFFHEKLKPLQCVSFGMAALGVMILTVMSGSFPWISVALAVSFGLYGLCKKKITLSALESLGSETLAALPIGLFLLLFHFGSNASGMLSMTSGLQELSYFAELPIHTLMILALCGIVTAIPLYLFTRGAKILPLSSVGFLQLFSPTLQFIMGYFVFAEYFPLRYFIALAFIWVSVIIYLISLKSVSKREDKIAK